MSSTTRSPKIERDRTAWRAHELLDQQPRDEQHLEPVAQPIGEKAHNSEAAIEEIGGGERERKGERRFGAALVAEPSAASRAFAESLGVSQQRLHGHRRGGPLGHDLERQHPLLVSQRHQADRQALMIGQARFGDARRFCRRHSRPRKAQARWRRPKAEISCSFAIVANGLADLRVGERQHPVAQRLIDRRQPIKTQEADDEAQRRPVDEQGEQHQAVASTATNLCISGVSAGFSVTASASTKVRAPRRPPQAMASL